MSVECGSDEGGSWKVEVGAGGKSQKNHPSPLWELMKINSEEKCGSGWAQGYSEDGVTVESHSDWRDLVVLVPKTDVLVWFCQKLMFDTLH